MKQNKNEILLFLQNTSAFNKYAYQISYTVKVTILQLKMNISFSFQIKNVFKTIFNFLLKRCLIGSKTEQAFKMKDRGIG